MGPGYQALRESAAYLDLSARGKIFASGEDRARLLHAMTTNQIEDARARPRLLRLLAECAGTHPGRRRHLYSSRDRILIDVEPEMLGGRLSAPSDKFIIADDVTLEDAGDSLGALCGGRSACRGSAAGDGRARTGNALFARGLGRTHRMARLEPTGALRLSHLRLQSRAASGVRRGRRGVGARRASRSTLSPAMERTSSTQRFPRKRSRPTR